MRYGFRAYVFLSFAISCSQSLIFTMQISQQYDPLVAYRQYVDASKQALNGFNIEPISFSVKKNGLSGDTFVRKGFLSLRSEAVGTVIICHGYTHSKYEAFFFKTLFPHFNVLAFDFRAHGELVEKDHYSTIGRDEIYDVLGAVEFVKSHKQLMNKPIIGFGFSMGAVALFLSQAIFQNLFDALILDSPFHSSNECMEKNIEQMLTFQLFGKSYKIPGKTLIMKSLYSERMLPIVKSIFKWSSGMNPNMVPTKFVPVIPIEKASKITIPCMFISCEQDKKVTVECVRQLYENVASSFKRLWITKGTKHCGSCLAQPEMYAYQTNKFIKKVFERNFAVPEKIRDDRVIIKAA